MDRDFNSVRVLRMQEVTEKVALQPSTIYAMVQSGKFPAPFKIAPQGRAAGWLLTDVDSWLLTRARTSDGTSSITQEEREAV
jgi:predicted DNA-binding transcriptional regulator AlpA